MTDTRKTADEIAQVIRTAAPGTWTPEALARRIAENGFTRHEPTPADLSYTAIAREVIAELIAYLYGPSSRSGPVEETDIQGWCDTFHPTDKVANDG